MLHYVLAGVGEIVVPNREAINIGPGSLVLVPALCSHTIRSFGESGDPVPVCRPAKLDLAHLISGHEAGDSKQLVAVCSRVSLSLRTLHDLVDLVRVPIIQNVGAGSLLAFPIKAMLHELAEPGPGSMAMIRTLLLACMIEMMRRRLQDRDPSLAWMAALRDPKLWPALQSMLDAPGDAHSLETLAARAGMARSTFAKRFTEAYGHGPMELLRELRMRRAAAHLIETDLPVKRIADLSGFRSRSAFTRTFEAVTGVSPQRFRQQNKDSH